LGAVFRVVRHTQKLEPAKIGGALSNSGCIGTAKITPEGSAATNFYTVAVDGGKELLLIETDNNSFLTGIAQE
jgi:hypothetical protein